MRRRNLLWTALIPLLIMATMAGIASAPTATKLSIEPDNFGMREPGEYLTFDIKVSDVVGLSSWEVRVEWDPFVIAPIAVYQGDFLSQGGMYSTYFAFSIPVTMDAVLIGELMLDPTTVSGSGILASVEVKIVGSGSSAIDLADTKLFDVNLNPIGHSAYNGKIAVHAVAEVTGRYEEHQRYSITGDEDDFNDMFAKITNNQDYPVNAYATFTGFGMTGMMIKLQSTTVTIPAKGEVVVSAGFNATQYGLGRYYFDARAYYELGGAFYRGAHAKTLGFEVIP